MQDTGIHVLIGETEVCVLIMTRPEHCGDEKLLPVPQAPPLELGTVQLEYFCQALPGQNVVKAAVTCSSRGVCVRVCVCAATWPPAGLGTALDIAALLWPVS